MEGKEKDRRGGSKTEKVEKEKKEEGEEWEEGMSMSSTGSVMSGLLCYEAGLASCHYPHYQHWRSVTKLVG